MKRGNIHNSPYAGRAKEYAWNLCLKYAPQGITPTDIDYVVERNGRFLFFEMKTEGATMSKAQEDMYKWLLKKHRGEAVLFIVEHPPLDTIEMPTDVSGLSVMYVSGGKVKEKRLEPAREQFIRRYARFFKWAGGRKAA